MVPDLSEKHSASPFRVRQSKKIVVSKGIVIVMVEACHRSFIGTSQSGELGFSSWWGQKLFLFKIWH